MSSSSGETAKPDIEEFRGRIARFKRALAGILILVGLYHWAVIVGIASIGGEPFAGAAGAWQWATINLAVAYLVAAVGLWLLAAWGLVIWIYAAICEIAMHTVFAGTFGFGLLATLLQLVLIGAYAALELAARRAEAQVMEDRLEEVQSARTGAPIPFARLTNAARETLAKRLARRAGPADAATADKPGPAV